MPIDFQPVNPFIRLPQSGKTQAATPSRTAPLLSGGSSHALFFGASDVVMTDLDADIFTSIEADHNPDQQATPPNLPLHNIEREVSPEAQAAIQANIWKINPLSHDAFQKIADLTNASRPPEKQPVRADQIPPISEQCLRNLNLLHGHIPQEQLSQKEESLKSSLKQESTFRYSDTQTSQTNSREEQERDARADSPETARIKTEHDDQLQGGMSKKERNTIAARKHRALQFRVQEKLGIRKREDSPETSAIKKKYDDQLEEGMSKREKNAIAARKSRALRARIQEKGVGKREDSPDTAAIKAEYEDKLKDVIDPSVRSTIRAQKHKALTDRKVTKASMELGLVREDSPETARIKQEYDEKLQGLDSQQEKNKIWAGKSHALKLREQEKAASGILQETTASSSSGQTGREHTPENQLSAEAYQFYFPDGSHCTAQDFRATDGTRQALAMETMQPLGASQRLVGLPDDLLKEFQVP